MWDDTDDEGVSRGWNKAERVWMSKTAISAQIKLHLTRLSLPAVLLLFYSLLAKWATKRVLWWWLRGVILSIMTLQQRAQKMTKWRTNLKTKNQSNLRKNLDRLAHQLSQLRLISTSQALHQYLNLSPNPLIH